MSDSNKPAPGPPTGAPFDGSHDAPLDAPHHGPLVGTHNAESALEIANPPHEATGGLPVDPAAEGVRPLMPTSPWVAPPPAPEHWPGLASTMPPPTSSGQSMLDLALAEAAAPGPTKRPATARRIWQRKPRADGDSRSHHEDETELDATHGPRSRRQMALAAAAVCAAIGIALLVVLGHFNAQRLAIHCEPDRIVATAGRSFPPWGESTLDAPEFAAIAIPKDTECTARTTNNRVELEDWYLTALMEQATARLSTRATTDVELASKQLEQALLLTRTATRRDARKEVDRLVGDVEYWRAAARLKSSSDALLDAATQFDAAAKKRPRHATDAAEWASHVRRLVEVLRAGPNGISNPALNPNGGLAPPEMPTSPTGPPNTPLNTNLPEVTPEDKTGSAPPPATGGVLL